MLFSTLFFKRCSGEITADRWLFSLAPVGNEFLQHSLALCEHFPSTVKSLYCIEFASGKLLDTGGFVLRLSKLIPDRFHHLNINIDYADPLYLPTD